MAGFSRDAMAQMMHYRWPGNVRELENEIEKIVALSNDGDTITPDMLSDQFSALATEAVVVPNSSGRVQLQELLDGIERKMISEALARHDGNKTKAAEDLGTSLSGLKKKIKRFGMEEF
jgi:two-component system response regulator HupR/HoxA